MTGAKDYSYVESVGAYVNVLNVENGRRARVILRVRYVTISKV